MASDRVEKIRQITNRLSHHRSIFWIFVSAISLLGLALGYRLSALPRLETYKFLNVAGLSYDFLGVLVLSELLASTVRWKNVCVKFLAPLILWLHTLIPFGAFLGASLPGQLMHKPSSEIVAKFFLLFFGYSLIPLTVFDEFVVFPRLRFVKRDVETRWRWFGLLLLLSGVGLQLAAAVLALGR